MANFQLFHIFKSDFIHPLSFIIAVLKTLLSFPRNADEIMTLNQSNFLQFIQPFELSDSLMFLHWNVLHKNSLHIDGPALRVPCIGVHLLNFRKSHEVADADQRNPSIFEILHHHFTEV